MDWRHERIKEWLFKAKHPVTRRALFQHFRAPKWLEAYRELIQYGELVERGEGTKARPRVVLVSDAAPSIPPYVLAVPYSAWQTFALRVISRNGDPAKELTDYLNG